MIASMHSSATKLINHEIQFLDIGATAADRSKTSGKSDPSARGTEATSAGEGGRKAEDLQQASGSRRRLGVRSRHLGVSIC